ncbi:hypothetical protein HYFRA_00004114 [Hymenoscyphus fraxineus]|uniref:Uncharacterized protein n=1 Tax=Hymenoscyphus fraxineus TaxID=746836 RepID=A0A9N9PKE3_9HELO|nr:hypothetical protein HYFRA_00004114 [Hymenoscyphus fraxineus]
MHYSEALCEHGGRLLSRRGGAYAPEPDGSQTSSSLPRFSFRPEQRNLEKMESHCDEFPGATMMWYGKFKDIKRIDELEDSYCRGLLKGFQRNPQNPNSLRFERLYAKYISTARSPMSYKIWFGEYRGHEMRKIYGSKRWEYLLRSDSDIKKMLLWIEDRWFEWKEAHPERRVGTERAQHVIMNPVGEKLGPWTDRDFEQDEDYDSDDGFVVKDDDPDMVDGTYEEESTPSEDKTDNGSSEEHFPDLNTILAKGPRKGVTATQQSHQPSIKSVEKTFTSSVSDSDDALLVPPRSKKASLTRNPPDLSSRAPLELLENDRSRGRIGTAKRKRPERLSSETEFADENMLPISKRRKNSRREE